MPFRTRGKMGMLAPRAALYMVLGVATALAGCSGGGGGGGGGGAAASTAAGAGTLAPQKAKSSVVVARSGEGWLESNQGKLFLHVKGTPREMGEQYGELLGWRIEDILLKLPALLATQR